jgi:hypothetical protein
MGPFLMTWAPTDDGDTIGTKGVDGGIIVADYEHQLGARLTMEALSGASNFAITCGIYDWFFHTRFFSNREDADTACREMQSALNIIIQSIPLKTDPELDAKCVAVTEAISNFVDTFP